MDAITKAISILEPAYNSPTQLSKLLTVNASPNSTNVIWQRYEETGSLYDGSLIFTHFTTQMPAFIGFCIIAVICGAIVVSSITIAIARFGCGRCGAKRYQPHPTPRCRFALLFILFAFCWFIMLLSLLAFAFGSIDFCSYRTVNIRGANHSLHSPITNETENVFKREAMFVGNSTNTHNIAVESSESDWQKQIDGLLSDKRIPNDIQNTNSDTIAGVTIDVETKTTTPLSTTAKQINESTTVTYDNENTGSDMHDIIYTNLHDKGTYVFTFAMLIVVVIPIILSLILSFFTVFTGTVCYLRSYHPMDRSNTSNRMGLWTVRISIFFLIVSPLLVLLADFSFAYAELHSQLCPVLQKNLQLKTFEQKLNSLGSTTVDDAEIMMILNGLRTNERKTFNERECNRHSRSAHALWISELFLGLFGFVCAIVLLCMSKFFLRMKTEYYWNSSDNYSTLSDVRPDCTKIVTVSSAF